MTWPHSTPWFELGTMVEDKTLRDMYLSASTLDHYRVIADYLQISGDPMGDKLALEIALYDKPTAKLYKTTTRHYHKLISSNSTIKPFMDSQFCLKNLEDYYNRVGEVMLQRALPFKWVDLPVEDTLKYKFPKIPSVYIILVEYFKFDKQVKVGYTRVYKPHVDFSLKSTLGTFVPVRYLLMENDYEDWQIY